MDKEYYEKISNGIIGLEDIIKKIIRPTNICNLILYIFHYYLIFLVNSSLGYVRAVVLLFLRIDSNLLKIANDFICEGYSFLFKQFSLSITTIEVPANLAI